MRADGDQQMPLIVDDVLITFDDPGQPRR